MTTANIDAFIVAGGLSPWLKSYAGTEHRCLAPLGDKRLIDYIIAALQGSGRIRRIVVAARPEALALLEGTLPADVLLSAYPDAKRTYGKLRDGIFTGGNMMLMAKEIIPGGQQKAREIFARRKSPLKLCNWLGWGFLIKLLCHRLTLADAETRTSALLEMRCKAIITRHACIGMDIDKPSDLELARRTLTYGKSQKN